MKPGRMTKQHAEYLRSQANNRFNYVLSTWLDCLLWAAPWRAKWLLSLMPGERNNRHVVDSTHILALRSIVAGFMEGNTSATRPWYRIGSTQVDITKDDAAHFFLDKLTRRTLQVLTSSNFYHQAGLFYYDYNVVNTGCHIVEEMPTGLHFHTLVPGSYRLMNNGKGEAIVLIREFSLTVKALVEEYGRMTPDGKYDWSNLSSHIKKLYEDCNYTEMVDICEIRMENKDFDPEKPEVMLNRQWITYAYETGGFGTGSKTPEFMETGVYPSMDKHKWLRVQATRRKPFIAGRAHSSNNFEYGEEGPTVSALGLIKSLNKKAIAKDQALEQILRPALQGPASLKKTYVTSQANSYVPLDPASAQLGGLKRVNDLNPVIGPLLEDVTDLRQQVDKMYFADFLLYLSRNPKTRTATETNAILAEQQLIIGPNLQSLNKTYNEPIVEYVMDYVLFDDPYFNEPIPESLQGTFLRPEFISVFAQAQRAADLPAVDRFVAMVAEVGQINPAIWDKVNVDRLADIYEDRLYLPAGLNRPQDEVDLKREQAVQRAEQQQMMNETIPAMAGAARDLGLNQGG